MENDRDKNQALIESYSKKELSVETNQTWNIFLENLKSYSCLLYTSLGGSKNEIC